MSEFAFQELELSGAYLIRNFHVGDCRGGFTKYFEKDIYSNVGIDFVLNESFASVSAKNVVRGLHFQTENPQAKLVSVIKGSVWDVIVDLRPESSTYKKWVSVSLTEDNARSLFVPRGFAHGFLALEDNTVMLYQCDGRYSRQTDTGILFNDPEIGINWPVEESVMIHSARDLQLMSFAEYESVIHKNPATF